MASFGVGVGVGVVRSVSSVVGGVADGAIARAGDEGGERDVYARRRRGRYGVRGAREGARGV